MNVLNRCIARVLIVFTVGMGLPLPVSADIVTTDRISASVERQTLQGFLGRAEVREQLLALGVDPQAVSARVAALTDDEVATLAGRLGELPAGGNVIGVLFAVFIILLVTDLLGLTKVFPFTRPVR